MLLRQDGRTCGYTPDERQGQLCKSRKSQGMMLAGFIDGAQRLTAQTDAA